MHELPDVPYFELAPDWLCEVLSPSTALFDKRVKLPLYASHSVAHVWLADPIERSLEVLLLDGPSYRLAGVFGGDERARIGPFAAIEFDCRRALDALRPEHRAEGAHSQEPASATLVPIVKFESSVCRSAKKK